MFDVAVVGAGLTGLALAHRLQALGMQVTVLEARDQAGGRIRTDTAANGAAVDVGASWYWPDTEPRMAKLVEALGLPSFEQPDQGQILHLADPNRGPEPMAANSIHGGAKRLSGGMASLTSALQAQLAPDTIKTGHRLLALCNRGDHIELQIAHPQDGIDHVLHWKAKRVVLAMPPRLIAQHVRFQPALPEATLSAMNAVQTWMAREAKAFVRFDRPFWLKQGQSGSAFVTHPQAVLREVWDASTPGGAALAGFCTMAPDTRQQFERSLPLLIQSQLAQLFGQQAQGEDAQLMDWAKEPWTCSTLDKQDQESAPPQADPWLRRPHWAGRLFFGGTETARQAPGHMEGALESAARLADFLRPALPASTSKPAASPWQDFGPWVAAEREACWQRYQQHMKQMMSRQDTDRVTQRSLLAAAEQSYTLALEHLAQWELPEQDGITEGRSALTPLVLEAFAGFSKSLVERALAFNGASCALSNFTDEYRPSADYLRAITADLAAAWREFAWSANDLLCARSQATC